MKFTKTAEAVKYKNPFSNNEQLPYYERVAPMVFKDGNAMIVKVTSAQYDYVVNGVCVTQRCGASKELLAKIVEHNVKAGEYQKLLDIQKEMRG